MNRFILDSGSELSSTKLDTSTWECIHCTFQNSTAEYPDVCELCSTARRSKPITTLKICPVCTYGNSLDAFRCVMCEVSFEQDEKKENLCSNNNSSNSIKSSMSDVDVDFCSISKPATSVQFPLMKNSLKATSVLDLAGESSSLEIRVVKKEISMVNKLVSRKLNQGRRQEDDDKSEDEPQDNGEDAEMSDFLEDEEEEADEDEDEGYSEGDSYSHEEDELQDTDDDEEAFIDSEDDNDRGKRSLLSVRKEKIVTKKVKKEDDEIEEFESDCSESVFFNGSPKHSEKKSCSSNEPRGELKPSFPQVSEHFW
jgi:hypothetical protein